MGPKGPDPKAFTLALWRRACTEGWRSVESALEDPGAQQEVVELAAESPELALLLLGR